MESAIPSKFTIKTVIEELKPTVEKMASEDELIAGLANFPEWEVLKKRIESRIESLERITDNVEEVDDLQLYGFKCMTKAILIDELRSIIDDVEMTAKVIKKKANEQGTKE